MASLRSDRRLYLTADKSEVVEEGDVRAAFLLVGADRVIPYDDVVRYKLALDGAGHVLTLAQREEREARAAAKQAAKPEDKMAPAPEDKAAPAPYAKDYADVGYQELRRLAAERDLDVPGRPKKDELIKALEAAGAGEG
ncbi:MAG: hypothetical protein ACOC3J_05800 [Gemmatimonadota bacterium]